MKIRRTDLAMEAQELWREVEWVGKQIDEMVREFNRKGTLSRKL